ncbi:MAG: dCTP deaminase [Candidatus Gracilibacteria bacterium]|nr:dCTP deaminase [Candidatus Gracilibacteria bacterium]
MILSDSEIKRYLKSGELKIQTSKEYDIFSQIGPASVDFRLGNTFRFYKRDSLTLIDPNIGVEQQHIETLVLDKDKPFILHPGQFVLGVTVEKIRIPYDLVARCEGRSSIGRLGVVIHSTAGYIDPGFEGTITLEITNINEVPVALWPGMRIGQFAFETLSGICEITYDKRPGSKYMNQILPETSRINKDLN